MAAIYVHIPFCKKACHYCNFHFSTSVKNKNELIACLLHEIDLQKNYFDSETIDSIYFGGGTPSLLSAYEIECILHKLKSTFKVSNNVEITIEANPDDITNLKLKELISTGVNRISLGVQSFFDEDLIYMNRSHDANDAIKAIEKIANSTIKNYSVDLIFGYPLLTNKKWQSNINTILKYDVPHISCYAMTVEPKTALAYKIAKNQYLPLNDEQSATQYSLLIDTLIQNDYEHYEISNFAKNNFQSKHNSSYWNETTYLGIGPSAHSYNGMIRQWNVSNNALYIAEINKNKIPSEWELLSRNEKINERLMISLRTANGLRLATFRDMLNSEENIQFSNKVVNYINNGSLIVINGTHLQLTSKGKLFADGIASALFF